MSYMYFCVSFHYANPWHERNRIASGENGGMVHINFGEVTEDQAANLALCVADRFAERALTRMKLEWKHAYSWPDGSCYKYVRVPADSRLADTRKLRQAIDNALGEQRSHYRKANKSNLMVGNISTPDPDELRHWGTKHTLAELFELSNKDLWELVDQRQQKHDELLEQLVLKHGGDRGKACTELATLPVER